MPALTTGHAIGDGVPAFRPAMIESRAPLSCTGRPARALSSRQASFVGSTPTTRAPSGTKPRTIYAANAPTPICTATSVGGGFPDSASTDSVSATIVA